MQEELHHLDIEVSHETLREWCVKFGPPFTEDLRLGNPGGLPSGISTRCAPLWMAFDISC